MFIGMTFKMCNDYMQDLDDEYQISSTLDIDDKIMNAKSNLYDAEKLIIKYETSIDSALFVSDLKTKARKKERIIRGRHYGFKVDSPADSLVDSLLNSVDRDVENILKDKNSDKIYYFGKSIMTLNEYKVKYQKTLDSLMQIKASQ
jgi:hypothetical protein